PPSWQMVGPLPMNRPVRSERGFGTSEWACGPGVGATIARMTSLIARLGRRVVLDPGVTMPIEATLIRDAQVGDAGVDARLRTVLAVAERLTRTFDRAEILQ